MAVLRNIEVGNQTIPMRASALIPRLYRVKFGRDIIRDLQTLQTNLSETKDDPDASLTAADLTVFEDVAWLLAKHADPAVPSDPDEWLDSLDGVLSVYEALPQILALWSDNLATTSVPVKK